MSLSYSEQKETDFGLLIPSHWSSERIKFCVSYNDESLPDDTDPDYEIAYVDISSVDLIKGITNIEVMPFRKAPSRARRIVKDGDTIVSTVRTYLKAIAPIKDPVDNLIVSTGFTVLRPSKKVLPQYLSYFFQSQDFVDAVGAHSFGVSYPAINPTALVRIPCVYPPRTEEQTQIAKFLDYKTAQIDRLIEKKKALIEKLNEQRIAMITEAVTKGLNPNAEMKDSEVDWLGEVPTHWNIMQFKDRCFVVSGQVDPTDPEYEDLPLIAPDHIEKGTGKLLELSSAKEQGAISGKYLFASGDLLYSKIRPELNKLCIAPSDGLCSADMYAIRTVKDIHIRFLYYLMLSKYFHQFAILESMRVAMPKINREALGALKILVPPLNEQKEIADHLKDSIEKIDSMKAVNNKTIERLNEYRTALITAAVTGKIDVRQIEFPGES